MYLKPTPDPDQESVISCYLYMNDTGLHPGDIRDTSPNYHTYHHLVSNSTLIIGAKFLSELMALRVTGRVNFRDKYQLFKTKSFVYKLDFINFSIGKQ